MKTKLESLSLTWRNKISFFRSAKPTPEHNFEKKLSLFYLRNLDNYKIEIVTSEVLSPIKNVFYVKYNEATIEYTVLLPTGKIEKAIIDDYDAKPGLHEQMHDHRVILHYHTIMNYATLNGHTKPLQCWNESYTFCDHVSYFDMILQNSHLASVIALQTTFLGFSLKSFALPLTELYLHQYDLTLQAILLVSSYILASFIYSVYVLPLQPPTVNAKTIAPFSQGIFDAMVRKRYPELPFNNDGNCFGHVHVWYEYLLKKKDYIKELNTVYEMMKNDENIKPTQLELLQDIANTQQCITDTYHFHSPDESYYLFGNTMHYQRRRVIQMAVDYAINRPNYLVCLGPQGFRSAHSIGLVSDEEGIIHTFDPNFGHVTYKDSESAKISLSLLLAYKYGFTLYNLMPKVRGNIEIQVPETSETSPPSEVRM